MRTSDKEFKEKISEMTDEELIKLAHTLHVQLRKARKHKDTPEKEFITADLKAIHTEQLFRKSPEMRHIINRITKKTANVLNTDNKENIAKENTQHQSDNGLPDWYNPQIPCDWVNGEPVKNSSYKEIMNNFKTDPNVIVHKLSE